MEAPRKVVLFTAQEPSGDAHAAPVIARLREAYPDLEPVAFGGPKMEAAGARMLGRTADDGVMGLAGAGKVFEVRALHNRIVDWARKNPVAVHVPVDSPSANFPLCARLKPMGVRIVNLKPGDKLVAMTSLAPEEKSETGPEPTKPPQEA